MAEYTLPVNYEYLTPVQRKAVREQYVREQKHKCYWCKAHLYGSPAQSIMFKSINWNAFPENFREYPIHLQHNHDTGMTEGAVHMRCNAVMWQYHNK